MPGAGSACAHWNEPGAWSDWRAESLSVSLSLSLSLSVSVSLTLSSLFLRAERRETKQEETSSKGPGVLKINRVDSVDAAIIPGCDPRKLNAERVKLSSRQNAQGYVPEVESFRTHKF